MHIVRHQIYYCVTDTVEWKRIICVCVYAKQFGSYSNENIFYSVHPKRIAEGKLQTEYPIDKYKHW